VCVEACKHRLLTIDNRSISWNTALSMLHLPPGLQEGDAFAALTEVRTVPHQIDRHSALVSARPCRAVLSTLLATERVCVVLCVKKEPLCCPACLSHRTTESTPAGVGHL
jgi:hypothetical protein